MTTPQFKVSLRLFPDLADHGLQNVAVLPGSFCIEQALLIHRELFREEPAILRNIRFRRPVILSEEDTVISSPGAGEHREISRIRFL